MDKLFLQILNMSITSSYVILFVIFIGFLLKKAPKIYSYILWAVVFIRLIIPISFESLLSLIPMSTNTIPQDIAFTKTPAINSGIGTIDGVVNNALPKPVVGASINPMQLWVYLGQIIWILGMVALIVYSVVSTVKLYKTLKSSRLLRDNIYETNKIEIPFVFGVIKPKIYIPSCLTNTEKDYIIRHEEKHIKRYDHILKFAAFIITTIHWFNPLVWIAYLLMSKDMELSCDEAVIKEMGDKIKKDYSTSLLKLSTSKRIVGGSPLAFGGKNTKSRIKNILNYKKPKFWVSLIGIITLIAVSISLLSNPTFDKDKANIEGNKYLNNIEFGIGDRGEDLVSKWGKAKSIENINGGLSLEYEDEIFYTDGYINDDKTYVYGTIEAIEASEGLGIKAGMRIEEAREYLGDPDARLIYDELRGYGHGPVLPKDYYYRDEYIVSIAYDYDTGLVSYIKLDNQMEEADLIGEGFMELTDPEKDLYENYIKDFDDNILNGHNPISIMKLYLHASEERNNEAEWELYTKKENYVLWDKEYHMNISKDEKTLNFDNYRNPTNIKITYLNNYEDVVITWEDKYLDEHDGDGNPFIFGFKLTNERDRIWKVSFLPIQ